MSARPRAPLALVVALVVAVLAPLPVGAQSIEEAREQRREVQQRLDAAADRLAELESRVGRLSDETDALHEQMQELEAKARAAETRVVERVRELYKRGIDTPILQLLLGEDAGAALERAELADHLLAGDRREIETAVAARTRVSETAEVLQQRRDALAETRDEVDQTLAALQDDLAAARELEERLVAEERARQEAARRRAEEARRAAAAEARQAQQEEEAAAAAPATSAPAPSSGGSLACPVGNPKSYSDTWGAPRSGGRSHKGVDILANYGTPVYAIVSGAWDIYSYGSSAGHWAILRGDNGHTYYYMHLQSHTVGDMARVSAGTQTGTVGDTGNARGTPHLHFEYHPGGGGAVNPTPLVDQAC